MHVISAIFLLPKAKKTVFLSVLQENMPNKGTFPEISTTFPDLFFTST